MKAIHLQLTIIGMMMFGCAYLAVSYADEVNDLEVTVIPMVEDSKKILEDIVLPERVAEQALLHAQSGLNTANLARAGKMSHDKGEEMRNNKSNEMRRNSHGEEMRLTRGEDDLEIENEPASE